MSRHCQSLASAMGFNRKRVNDEDMFQGQYQLYSTYSSSPPQSSSPPSTPHSSRHYREYAYIRSSPGFGADAVSRSVLEERIQGHWSQSYSSWKSASLSYIRRTASVDDHPLTSDYDPSEFSENSNVHVQCSESIDLSDNSPISSYSDSAEEQDEIFSSNSYRSTFFRTSAERGLWKHDPMPPKKSVPAVNRLRTSGLSLSGTPTPTGQIARTVSEPTPTTTTDKDVIFPAKGANDKTKAVARSEEGTIFSRSQSIAASFESRTEDEISSQTLPSLTTDKEGSEVDIDLETDEGRIMSPLPPSSPPLSPLSRSISILSRSSSPISFVYERSSSPLSELPDDYDDEESYNDHEKNDLDSNSKGHASREVSPEHSSF